MTTLTISIIVVFVLGYALIATESLTKVNKAAIALLMLVGPESSRNIWAIPPQHSSS